MNALYFKPFIGKKFKTTKVLILSESAYDWPGDDGKVRTPSHTHPKDSLLGSIDEPEKRGYFTIMSRALCGSKSPTEKDKTKAWNGYAYTIYVQGSVGLGPDSKPTPKQFRDARPQFFALIEKIRPLKVIVTGKNMWNRMPRTYTHRGNDLQAYKLSDGTLVWCLAVPHPANRTEGFNWKRVSRSIRRFRAAKLPRRT